MTVWPDRLRHVTWEWRPLLSVRTIVSVSETTTGSSQGETDERHDEWQPGLEVMLWCQLSSSSADTQLSSPHGWRGNGVIEKKKHPWRSRLTCFQPKCSIRLKWNWQKIRMSFRRTWRNNLQSRNWCSVSVGYDYNEVIIKIMFLGGGKTATLKQVSIFGVKLITQHVLSLLLPFSNHNYL